mgnify:CR=1 FL=1
MKKILSSTLRIILFTAIVLLTNNVLAQSEIIYNENPDENRDYFL